jgi:hypothetical protein
MQVNKDKEFVLSIYPDAVCTAYDLGEVYTGALSWFRGQHFVARVKPKTGRNVAIAYDMLAGSVYNEESGWEQARRIIEKRMLKTLES